MSQIVEKADALLATAKGLVEGVNGMKSEITVFGEEKYNQGWAEAMAQAGSAGSTDKIYSEAELDAEIALVRGPLEQQIAGMTAQIEQMTTDMNNQIANAVSSAVTSLKTDLAAKFENTQVDDAAFLAGLKA